MTDTPSHIKQVLGVFSDEKKAASAIVALKGADWVLKRVYGPFPSQTIQTALGLKKSRVGYFTLAGGVIGFVFGLWLAVYTASQWDLVVSGKPIIAWFPFFIVAFEFTILFSVLGNVTGLLMQTRLPDFPNLENVDPRCSSDHFGVVAACKAADGQKVMALLKHHGGETRILAE